MARLPGFRSPQFSEEDTWLPCWLQRCNDEWLDVESTKEDHITFEQRVEEFRDINSGDSLRNKGGCNIGQLFISGTDSSPFSFAQSANDVVHFHLCLSSDGDSDNTALSNDACEIEPNYLIVSQPRGTFEIQKDANLSTPPDTSVVNCTQTVELARHVEKIEQLKLDDSVNSSEAASDAVELCIAASEALVINEVIDSDSLEKCSDNTALSNDACEIEPNYLIVSQPRGTFEIQKDANLSTPPDTSVVNCTQTVELARHVEKIEQLKLDDSVNSSEAASDAVELCIAASEALVINEVIDSDSLEKCSSTSATLEASLQLKEARLEVWRNTFADSFSVTSDMDNLSDLDDITMESVYEDAGIHFNELTGNELSVSQVKDTLESEHDELLEHNKTSLLSQVKDTLESARICDDFDNELQLGKDLAAEYTGSEAENKVVCNPVCDLGIDVGLYNDCLRDVNAQTNCHPSVSAEEVNTLTPEGNPHESHVSFSPIMSNRDGEKDNFQSNIVQERFHSRWLGGWSSNNEVKCATLKCRIPEPFVGQTSFLSESAYTAPDVNSFVQNHDKQAVVASQLSIPSENFSNRANDGMLLSQEVASSSASLVDPLCSYVPSSIPENLCSSPTLNYVDPIFPITVEYKKDNVLDAPSLHNMPAEEDNVARQTADKNDSGTIVYRRSASLRDYSMLPSHTMLSGKDSHQKRSFLIAKNSKLTFQETDSRSREEAEKAGAELQVLNKGNSAQSLSPVVNHRTKPYFHASSNRKYNFAEENPIRTAEPESMVKQLPCENLQPKLLHADNQSAQKLPAKKRVHFSERETNIPENKKVRKLQTASKPCYSTRAAKKLTRSSAPLESRAQQMDRCLRVNLDKKKKRLIFQNMDFLLTGFSQQKEKEIDGLIRKYGGIVLSQIPSANSKGMRSSRSKPRVLPIVLCLKKIQSFKFLYGCAVNAYALRVNWLIDSIAAGFVLQPNRYMILPRNIISRNDQAYTAVKYNTHSLVFNNLGVMLHGKTKYFTNITTILKHGGAQVFKTLQSLIQTLETGRISMGVLVAEEESRVSRHLRHCAMEQNIHVTSVYWIIKCLYAGQLIPLEGKGNSRCPPAIELQRHLEPMELSQEI